LGTLREDLTVFILLTERNILQLNNCTKEPIVAFPC